MGISRVPLYFLQRCYSYNINFDKTLILGRQMLYCNTFELDKVFKINNFNINTSEFIKKNKYADSLFKRLGAAKLDILDYSTYENANIIHDLNKPIQNEYKEKYNVVYDGGTLEHVFNFPIAIKNCMDLVKVGGYFCQATVANNLCGHGFYQFSPELNFRIFCHQNGFKCVEVVLKEIHEGNDSWYLVSDPDVVNSRVELTNTKKTYMLTIAKKVHNNNEILNISPLQSDYTKNWNDPNNNKLRREDSKIYGGFKMLLKLGHFLPIQLKKRIYNRLISVKKYNSNHYSRLTTNQYLSGIHTT